MEEQTVTVFDTRKQEYMDVVKRPMSGVTLYFDVMDMIEELSDAELGELTRDLLHYGLAENNNEPFELKTENRMIKMLFPTMKAKHDADRKMFWINRQKQSNRSKSRKCNDLENITISIPKSALLID